MPKINPNSLGNDKVNQDLKNSRQLDKKTKGKTYDLIKNWDKEIQIGQSSSSTLADWQISCIFRPDQAGQSKSFIPPEAILKFASHV